MASASRNGQVSGILAAFGGTLASARLPLAIIDPDEAHRGVPMEWQERLITDSADIRDLLLRSRRIAVLGIKTEKQSGQPAYYVPQYMQRAGYEIIPVPVYYPDVQEILGQPVYRNLAGIPSIDIVNVFRRSEDIPPHLEDLIAAAPTAVWFQSGIRNDAAAERLARAGIAVVQDRCIMIEHGRAIR